MLALLSSIALAVSINLTEAYPDVDCLNGGYSGWQHVPPGAPHLRRKLWGNGEFYIEVGVRRGCVIS
jgi:hypothetical protein